MNREFENYHSIETSHSSNGVLLVGNKITELFREQQYRNFADQITHAVNRQPYMRQYETDEYVEAMKQGRAILYVKDQLQQVSAFGQILETDKPDVLEFGTWISRYGGGKQVLEGARAYVAEHHPEKKLIARAKSENKKARTIFETIGVRRGHETSEDGRKRVIYDITRKKK